MIPLAFVFSKLGLQSLVYPFKIILTPSFCPMIQSFTLGLIIFAFVNHFQR
jgi:hypothetical protein